MKLVVHLIILFIFIFLYRIYRFCLYRIYRCRQYLVPRQKEVDYNPMPRQRAKKDQQLHQNEHQKIKLN